MESISKRAVIIVYSYHHMNTEKVAHSIAAVLGAEVKQPQDIRPEEVGEYALVGFGAGIDSGKHYKPVLELAGSLPDVSEQKAFIFSTAGISNKKKMDSDHKALREILLSKGYNIIDEFACKGYNTNSVLKYIGGMNKGRPNAEDLRNAEDFARELRSALG